MQQRVALARALVYRPRVLLLDEPLAALDRKLREGMRDELRAIQRSVGITTVFVTHDQAEALGLSDRIAVMSQGRIEQLGAPREIYERPATRFVADFIGASTVLRGRAVAADRVTVARRRRSAWPAPRAARGRRTSSWRSGRSACGWPRRPATTCSTPASRGSSTRAPRPR